MPETLPVAVRAYASPPPLPRRPGPQSQGPKPLGPSEWALVFDTETTTDATQQIRFLAYQVRDRGDLFEAGLAYHPASLDAAEVAVLKEYAARNGLAAHTVAEFIDEVFYRVGYDLGARIIGFNLPFDLSRLAIHHAAARGKTMRGGFTFQLSPNPKRPWVQVKHIDSSKAIIRFTATPNYRTGRAMRRRKEKRPTRRGFFIDVKSLGKALTGQNHSLASLAKLLGTEHQKLDTDEHGGPLTAEYLGYAVQDVQATWECFDALERRYAGFSLKATPLHRIVSEASIGKAYLREMGVRPWRSLQPDFPPQTLGIIMSTYYGGRSEVHIRRVVTPVLYCDFLSMYPTVCTLMGLWRFVIAKGV